MIFNFATEPKKETTILKYVVYLVSNISHTSISTVV